MDQDIRFVDLKTGNTFDGSDPYVFWFDGEQSVDLIYTQPICFIANTDTIEVSIESNSIFYLVDTTKLTSSNIESIHDFNYYNITDLKTTSISSIGTQHHNYYVHMIYVLATSDVEGEYIEDLTINNLKYKIGADFYSSDETLTINLANNGVEIPSMVQKALYDVNIHEEQVDNITINRKWKELLSNFWDTVANKGSYKSLFNSLKWFEYGDKIKMYEVWENISSNQLFRQEITQMLSSSYINTLNGFAKTTYIALAHALENHKVDDNGRIILDTELNPELEQITSKWSIQDLSLKLCVLGNFYETYFMPIHLDLLHSTIEDIVYTSPFKVKIGHTVSRTDYLYHYEDMECSVKDNSIYRLGLVECYVGPKTLFKSQYDDLIVGVQKTVPEGLMIIPELRDYVAHLYKEIGAVVDFTITIPDPNKNINIKRETIVFKTWNGSEWVYKSITEQQFFNNSFSFSLLCPIEGDYEVRLIVECTNNKTYTKQIKFKVLDTEHVSLNVYKICNFGTLDDCTLGQFNQINTYTKSIRRINSTINPINQLLSQYIPAYIGQPYVDGQFVHKGVCLNHLLIYKNQNNKNNQYLTDNYFLLTRGSNLICVSKQYGFQPDLNQEPQENIYRKDYIFVPEFHTLVPLVTNEFNVEDYKVTDSDALCIIPELSYGKDIEEFDWEFINTSRPDLEPIKLSYIKEPFIADTKNSLLPAGYYTVVFKYRLTNEEKINTITLDSAFIKV